MKIHFLIKAGGRSAWRREIAWTIVQRKIYKGEWLLKINCLVIHPCWQVSHSSKNLCYRLLRSVVTWDVNRWVRNNLKKTQRHFLVCGTCFDVSNIFSHTRYNTNGVQVNRYIYITLYNDVNATRAVIGRCPWSIRVQIHGWRHGKLVFFVLFNMARGFENVCEIISDWGKWKLRKKFSRSYLQRRKMEKRRPKKLLTTCRNS